MKVLEVDLARKRISLSIKQAEEAPTGTQKRTGAPRLAPAASKEKDLSALPMDDALAALKKKFGK